jgi:hypothetical protein
MVAEAFANALDRGDFARVRGLVAPECRYDLRAASLTDEGTLVGPDAIIESYRSHDSRARRLFDRVEYCSAVEAVAGLTATIRFGDVLEKDGQRHTYSCRQRITLNDSGAIESIVQQDSTEETVAVRAFMERVGVKL